MGIRKIMLSVALLAGGLWPACRGTAAETEALSEGTPWRVFLVCQQESRNRKDPVAYTVSPPSNWLQADFDDSGWGRYGADLYQAVGGYGYGQSASTALLCMRTRFGINDPAQAKDLALSLEYRGGVVVYVNGKEVARQHLPKDKLEALTRGEDYPPEAFTDAAGVALPVCVRPAEKEKDRYEQRIRSLTVVLPAAVLQKGANTLAVELHASAPGKSQGGKNEYSMAGLCNAKLVSKAGVGVTSYADATKGVTIWNASPLETVSVLPGKRQCGFLWWGVTVTPVGLTRGNPFDPLQPIRVIAPRGGTGSGQVVVSGAGPLTGVKATITSLRNAGGKADAVGGSLPQAMISLDFGDMAAREYALAGELAGVPAAGDWTAPPGTGGAK